MTVCKLYVLTRNRLLCNILSVTPHLYILLSYYFLLTSFILAFAALLNALFWWCSPNWRAKRKQIKQKNIRERCLLKYSVIAVVFKYLTVEVPKLYF